MRHDVFSYQDWTSLYYVSPMRETLAEVCDFNQLNDPTHMRVAVTATKSGMLRLRGQPGFCPLRHAQGRTGTAHTRPHLGKWWSTSWLPDDCDRRRSLLGRRFVRQHSDRSAAGPVDIRGTGRPSDFHRQPVCNPLQSSGEPARGAGADAGNRL
jgi:hypothetical protein